MKKESVVGLVLLVVFCVGNAFAQNEKKTAFAMLLDNTGSMRNQFDVVINIGKAVVREIDKNGSITLFSFDSSDVNSETAKVKTGVDSSKDKNSFNEYLDNLYVVTGRTALSDATFLMANAVNSKAEREKDKSAEKVLILVTDGEERKTDIKPRELIKFLKDNKIKVYAIGLITKLSLANRYVSSNVPSQARAKTFLTNLAEETGGRAVFPKENEKAEDIVKNLLAEITK